MKIIQLINPNYPWKNWVKQMTSSQENLLQRYILCPHCNEVDRSNRVKTHQKNIFIFLFFYDQFHITFCTQTPITLKKKLLKKIMTEAHNKIFGDPSKIFKNISWSVNVFLKYFMAPANPSAPPTLLHT